MAQLSQDSPEPNQTKPMLAWPQWLRAFGYFSGKVMDEEVLRTF